jgi:hypothetical protein
LWVRDTALRLRAEGIALQKNALNHVGRSEAIYIPNEGENDSWAWEPGPDKKREDLTWLIK